MENKTDFIELLCNPDRAMLEEELTMVVDRAKGRGIERRLIADTLYWLLRRHMTPTEDMTPLVTLEWNRQLRCYHNEIGNTLEILDELLNLPPVKK